MKTKLVLVVRKDLKNSQGHKVRTGKLFAQVGHSSNGFMVNDGKFSEDGKTFTFTTSDSEIVSWLTDGLQSKIALGVNSEEELMDIYKKAKDSGLRVHLVQDAGLTEFNGETTRTCLAIGPHESSKIDKITNNLKLY